MNARRRKAPPSTPWSHASLSTLQLHCLYFVGYTLLIRSSIVKPASDLIGIVATHFFIALLTAYFCFIACPFPARAHWEASVGILHVASHIHFTTNLLGGSLTSFTGRGIVYPNRWKGWSTGWQTLSRTRLDLVSSGFPWLRLISFVVIGLSFSIRKRIRNLHWIDLNYSLSFTKPCTHLSDVISVFLGCTGR